jgi:hypothetical protein
MDIIKEMTKKYVIAYEANTDSDLQDHAADEINVILKDITNKKFSSDEQMIQWLRHEFDQLIAGLEDGLN